MDDCGGARLVATDPMLEAARECRGAAGCAVAAPGRSRRGCGCCCGSMRVYVVLMLAVVAVQLLRLA